MIFRANCSFRALKTHPLQVLGSLGEERVEERIRDKEMGEGRRREAKRVEQNGIKCKRGEEKRGEEKRIEDKRRG